MVGVLILASLAMITVYFRESPSGGLHGFQSAGVSVLRPFEIGANRRVQALYAGGKAIEYSEGCL